MDLSLIIAVIASVLSGVAIVIDLIRLCFYILFESSKKEK